MLPKELSENISTIIKNLMEKEEWENKLFIIYSEFSRKGEENTSSGTVHGTAAPYFIRGGKVSKAIFMESSFPAAKT